MEKILTLDMVTQLPNEIIKNSEKYDKHNVLLMQEVLDNFSLKKIRFDVEKKFEKYKSLKCLYSLPIDNPIKITSNYNIDGGIRSGNVVNIVENIVINKLDSQLWLLDFYNAMLLSAYKLTKDEAKYIVDALFYREREDIISFNLSICKQTLQKVKKSALIKVWIELQEMDKRYEKEC